MAESDKRKNGRALLNRTGYGSKAGGHLSKHADKYATKHEIVDAVHEHEGNMHSGRKKTRLKLKDGGVAEGFAPKRRADRLARGGKAKKHGHTTVNVLVGGDHPSEPKPVPVPVPVPGGGAGGPPPMAGPPPGMMPPGAGGPPPGMPPPGAKKGGRIEHNALKRGGRAKGFEAGSGGGLGRLEKAEAYGAKTGAKEKVGALKRK